jgi:Thioredoxin domain/HEAT repeats
LKSPAHILVLMSEACPHCPGVVRSALSLAVRQPLVTVSVVEALQFSDLAERYKVKATPTTVINDGMTIVGLVSGEELAGHLLRAEEPGSFTQVLESMINGGRAEDAAELICSRKEPEAILPLYRAPEFSTRMGVLVTLEEALDKDPRVLDSIVDDLSELLSSDDVGLRGDTAELLGKIGNPRAVPALQKVAQDPDEDVREAVQEALELLET